MGRRDESALPPYDQGRHNRRMGQIVGGGFLSFGLVGLVGALILLAPIGCTDSPTAPPSVTPIAVESSVLFSGGEGILVSDAFQSIDLVPLSDSLEVVPHRWSNFHVLFAGDTVESWRVSEDRMGFRVPASYSGSYPVSIHNPDQVPQLQTLQVRVIGATPGYSAGWGCGDGWYGTEFVPISSEELLLFTSCSRLEPDLLPEGIIRLTPGTMFEGEYLADRSEWTDELWFNGREPMSDSFRRMWAAGPSVRSGHAVVERYPASEGDSSSTWIWKFGSDPGPVEPIDCLPPDYGWGRSFVGYTAVEIAPGECLSVTGERTVYLHGSEQLMAEVSSVSSHPSFRVARNGTAALRSIWLETSQWPVFRPADGLAYVVEGYRVVHDVAFSPEGDTMFVIATVGHGEDVLLALDMRNAADGALEKRLEFECESSCWDARSAVAHDGEHLWTLRGLTVDGDWQSRVELRDPADLGIIRSVAVPEHLRFKYYSRSGAAIGQLPVLLPDATGRRAYIFSEIWAGHAAAGYMMELY